MIPEPKAAQMPGPSRQSLRGLDWFIFFLADVQTGFGPFIAVYLTSQKWTQIDIGLVLSIGGVVGLIGQVPGGAIVDAARSERVVAAYPPIYTSVRAQRAFLARAVHYLVADAGIRQFLDIGTGLPSAEPPRGCGANPVRVGRARRVSP